MAGGNASGEQGTGYRGDDRGTGEGSERSGTPCVLHDGNDVEAVGRGDPAVRRGADLVDHKVTETFVHVHTGTQMTGGGCGFERCLLCWWRVGRRHVLPPAPTVMVVVTISVGGV